MKKYPLFRKENIPAYITVIIVWLVVSAISAVIIASFIEAMTFKISLIITAITTMCGMGIMFGASVLNLRKLGPGFSRLAEGQSDPEIPPVWCPVLTAATNAAIDLASKKNNQTS